MIVYDKFLEWAEDRFGDVKVHGDEIMINSVFCEEHGLNADYKHHLSCNPSGGRSGSPNGVYHCWKTNEGGSLVSLVMKVDHCTYEDALDLLGGGDIAFHELERKVAEMFLNKVPEEVVVPIATFQLPENTFKILELPTTNVWRTEAEDYLKNRKLNPEDYLVCIGGQHQNRIIIPYYDAQHKLIYWNGRSLTNSKKIPKYLGPNKECGVGKGDVIYMPDGWPPHGVKIHITEGEFDAKSISLSGLAACAVGGKELNDKQSAMLFPYKPVLCFDTDTAGKKALLNIGDGLKEKGFSEVYYVHPPEKYKDWNEMLVAIGPKMINAYIRQNIGIYSNSTSLEQEILQTKI